MQSKAFNTFTWVFSSILLKIQAGFYLIFVLFVLKKHKKIYFENYTDGNIVVYDWLFKTNLVFLSILPITILKDYFAFSNYNLVFNLLNISLLTVALTIFCWFILKALNNPKLFRAVDLKIKTNDKFFESYFNGGKETEKQREILNNLSTYMIEHEPFLNSSLTLNELSSKLNIPSRELSFLINKKIGKHFFDFINEYRINKAKILLKDFRNNKYTIQEVFYKTGFNSKSSFNTAFKKHTGVTPTEFKKNNM